MAKIHITDAVFDLSGGAEGGRTPDLYTASVALSQLSYSPIIIFILPSTTRKVERSFTLGTR